MKKVEVWELKVGMYVNKLDRPWLETPFLLQGLWITSPKDIQDVKKYCQYVYIDPDRGLDVDAELAGVQDGIYSATPAGTSTVVTEKEPVYKDQASFEKEIEVSREIHNTANDLVHNLYDDVEHGKKINTEGAKASVMQMVDSIIRNPDAQVWLTQLKSKDEYTAIHSLNVCILSLAFGRHMGFPKEMLQELGMGALLHDLGKIKVPNELLNKPTKLTDREFALMKKHPVFGGKILVNTKGLSSTIIDVAISHHERVNGSGYPRGISADQISLYGKMVAIVDVYDAITSQRSYHHGINSLDAMKKLYEMRQSDLDYKMVEQFIQCMGIYPVGSFVELSTGEIGIVASINRQRKLKPRVMIVMNKNKVPVSPPRIIDLAKVEKAKGGMPYNVKTVIQPSTYNLDVRDYINF